MLIRSIYGETPEGAVPVEDRGPNKDISPSKASWGGLQQIGFQKESHRTTSWGD